MKPFDNYSSQLPCDTDYLIPLAVKQIKARVTGPQLHRIVLTDDKVQIEGWSGGEVWALVAETNEELSD